MNPRYNDIDRLAPDLAAALEPQERDAVASDPDASRALAQWAALRDHLASGLASELPASELLVLYALDEEPATLDDAERARLADARSEIEAALDAHPSLQAVIARIRSDRDAFYALFDEGGATAPRRADRPAERGARQRGTAAHRWVWRGAAIAAVLAFAVASIFLFQREAGFETVRTASGESRTVTLADGSVARLAGGTTLEYRIGANDRRVRLTGEAVFDVMPGDRLFTVETASALTTVLGTTFGVTADAQATEVVLANGVVSVAPRAAPAEAVRLEPGQRSRVTAGREPEAPQSVDVADRLAWTGTWYFQATPLAEIARRLEEHYDTSVVVPAGLAGERITGAFDQDVPVDQTLRTLATALGIHVEGDQATGYRFSPAGG